MKKLRYERVLLVGVIFVMGDNRNHSVDSRNIGYIDFDDQVVGRVFFKVF